MHLNENECLQGWSSAYSIEAVIMQISATLVKGKAKVNFQENTRVRNSIVYNVPFSVFMYYFVY